MVRNKTKVLTAPCTSYVATYVATYRSCVATCTYEYRTAAPKGGRGRQPARGKREREQSGTYSYHLTLRLPLLAALCPFASAGDYMYHNATSLRSLGGIFEGLGEWRE